MNALCLSIGQRRIGRRSALRGSLASALVLGAAPVFGACSSDDLSPRTIRSALGVPGSEEHVSFADNGKLSGGMEGYAWVAAASAASIEAPSPCNESGCFTETQKGLCVQGSMPALQCSGGAASFDCNYAANWGAMVGLNPERDGGAWGALAPQTIAVSFSGTPGAYRLTAHVVGDPMERIYCVDGYVSGLSVTASHFRSECWASDGEPLRDFTQVDRIGLVLNSAKQDIAFDYCVSDVTLNAPLDEGRVLIGANGKLSGPMSGYAWVAASDAATLARPVPCNRSGCFSSTDGKLCMAGSMPALECTGAGAPDMACNWQKNWGVMIGMNPGAEAVAWGDRAAERISVVYSGTRGTYRLTAHVAGEPYSENYCVDAYQSGSEVTAEMFRSHCWDGSGKPLASLADVDSLALMLASEQESVDFDYCISEVSAL